jgi:O-antigen/teichoic acid export membrane protein
LKNQIYTLGIFWIGQICFFVLNFISSKQLEARDYALYSIVLALIMFGMRFVEVGIGDFYLLKGKDEHLKTILTINLIKGAVICCLFLVFSFFVDDFYEVSEISSFVFVVSFIFLIEPLKNPTFYRYYKEKRMIEVITIERVSYILSLVLGIFLMIEYKSVWILVITYMLYFISQTAFSYVFLPVFPKAKFDKGYSLELIKFSKHIIGFIVLAYFMRQGLDLIIPKIIGIDNFAIYSFTFLIGVSPTNFLIYPLNKLLFPIYTSVKKDKLGALLDQILSKSFLLILVLALAIYFVSPMVLEFFNHTTLFDYKLLGYVLLYTVIRGLTANLGIVYKSLNIQKVYNRILILEAAVIVIMLLTFHENVYYIIFSLGVAMLVHFVVGLFVLSRHIKLSPKNLIISILIGCVLVSLQLFLSYNFKLEIILIVLNLTCFGIMLASLLFSLRPYFIRQ